MAGAGYKLFTTGQVLTAAEVNTYLQEQTVMVFNDAASRTTALSGVLAEGMVSYLKSTKVVEIYNGTAWASLDDPNAIQNTIVDAKGDLISASGNDVPARLAVGNNGETLVADSSASTGLRWQSNFAAGKNKIINGDFGIWQRGTSFTNPASTSYCADRYQILFYGSAPTTYSVTQQTFTPGTAPVSGYEGATFWRSTITTLGSASSEFDICQPIEDVRTFAGQTMTLSFWAKADSTRSVSAYLVQRFNSSPEVTSATQSATLSTSWQRFSFTFSVPSITGKTIGSGSSLLIRIRQTAATGSVFDLWGVQVEAGSVATAFQTATGTLAGELAAASRYYYRQSVSQNQAVAGTGGCVTTTIADSPVVFPVNMRTAPSSSIEVGSLQWYNYGNGSLYSSGTFTLVNISAYNAVLRYTHGSGVFTAGQSGLAVSSGGSGFLGISAEL